MTLYESGSDRQYPHLQIRPEIASKDFFVQYNKELLSWHIHLSWLSSLAQVRLHVYPIVFIVENVHMVS